MANERIIHTHKGNACNDALTVRALGTDANCHHYKIDGPYKTWPQAIVAPIFQADLEFQNGAVAARPDGVGSGVNGITNESLLAVLIDRLENFQAGPFACEENEDALDHLRKALTALQDRTARRVRDGTEGTLQGK